MVNLNSEEQVIEFISFCIENYKVDHSLKGKEVTKLFADNNVIGFLADSYELLHTQSKRYIIEEIDLYLKNRGYLV